MVDLYGNKVTYFYVFVHENYETRFEMSEGQMIEVGLEEDIRVLFEKTKLQKISSESSRCIDAEDFFGLEHCIFKEVHKICQCLNIGITSENSLYRLVSTSLINMVVDFLGLRAISMQYVLTMRHTA